MKKKIISGCLSISLCLPACTATGDTPLDYSIGGGFTGAAIGAGTGAAIGSVIANGDVAASALLGAGVGLGAGVAIGLIAYQSAMADRSEDYGNQIAANQAEIASRQARIDSYRRRAMEESVVAIDTSKSLYLYTGQKLGNPRR